MPSIIDSLVDFTNYDDFRLWLEELRDALTPEDWRNVSTDAVNGYENSWADNTVVASFYKDPFGIVRLKGNIDTGTSGTVAFTLPEGYRPDEAQYLIALGAGGAAGNFVLVGTDGTVTPTMTGANINLNDISFRVK